MKKELGVRLWDDRPKSVNHLEVEKLEFPSLCDEQPVIRLLKNAWNCRGGTSNAAVIVFYR